MSWPIYFYFFMCSTCKYCETGKNNWDLISFNLHPRHKFSSKKQVDEQSLVTVNNPKFSHLKQSSFFQNSTRTNKWLFWEAVLQASLNKTLSNTAVWANYQKSTKSMSRTMYFYFFACSKGK